MTSQKKSFSFDELVECSQGRLFGEGNAQLPHSEMLMFDSIQHIDATSGDYKKGLIEAFLSINPSLWFFDCHFTNDPVMPGCLGLDAMWQLVGFYLGWSGYPGRGRALGVKEVKFTGQILPNNKKVTYKIHMKRLINRSLTMGIGDGYAYIDGKEIYVAKDLKVGLFTSIEGF